MKPDQQPQGGQPTITTGSDWQRQALAAARAAAATQKPAVTAPGAQAARERAAAQDVPDMLAAADPVPAQPAQQPATQQQSQPAQTQTAQTLLADQSAGRPVVSGALTQDIPEAEPIVGTGGTTIGKKILVILLVSIFVLGAAAAGYFFFMQYRQQGGSTHSSASQQDQEGTEEDSDRASSGLSSMQIAERNADRLADVGNMLSAVAQFVANNAGKLPNGFVEGQFVGDEGDIPVPVSLRYYQTIQLTSGEQAPLETDELWLVTGVICDPGGSGGTVVGDSPRSVAAIYGHENDTGGFEGECKDG